MKMAYESIFSEIKVGSLILKNRIIFPPISTNFASVSGEVTPRFICHYARRAKGGAALVTVENMCIKYPSARHGATQPRIDDDRFIPGLSLLAYEIHKYNSLAFLELTHPGLFSEPKYSGNTIPVAPSDVDLRKDHLRPHILTKDEIYRIVDVFAQAALRAKKAHFDGVEIEAAHGLLVNQFLSPITNKRTDEFGGSLENRVRFAFLIIKRIKEVCGSDFTVMARLGVTDFVDGGVDIKEGARIARAFEAIGYAALHADIGFGNKEFRLEPMQYKEAWRTVYAEALKKEGIKVPVVAVGMIRNPFVANEIVSTGRADLIALGRPLIADPDWPIKAETGRDKEIKRCIGCSECIKARHDEGTAIRCGVNPAVGTTGEMEIFAPAFNNKKVLIVGAGPAGLETAIVLRKRGINVEIWEKNPYLGGALYLASIPPGKGKLRWLLEYYDYMIKKLSINIKFGRFANSTNIEKYNPDSVVVAIGSECLIPPIKGIDRNNSVVFKDVLTKKVVISGKKVVVGGGGLVGCETALYLASMNNKVIIVKRRPEIAPGMENLSKNYLLRELKKQNVQILTGAPVKEIGENFVKVGDNKIIPADYFIIALGRKSNHTLFNILRKKFETYLIGDAVKARRIIDAVREGNAVAKII